MKTRKLKQKLKLKLKLSKRKIGGTTIREHWNDYQDVTSQNRKEDYDAFVTFLQQLFKI